tara:strand:- start:878 stop:1609 length:732 start_codon:yes stop_codon:yes gene_type:complete
MINKSLLQSTISKYYLNDLHKSVKWRIKDNTLTVYAQSEGLVCRVVLNNFPLHDSEIGVFDTDKLVKLLSITNGELLLNLIGQRSVYNTLNIEDQNFNLTYTLSDPLTIGKTSWTEDVEYEVILDLSSEDLVHLIKSKTALDAESVVISTTSDFDKNKICEFTFSPESIDESYSNKISYQISGDIKEENINLPFNADKFNKILSNNKDSEYSKLSLSKKGMMKIEFTTAEINSVYYLLRNEQI